MRRRVWFGFAGFCLLAGSTWAGDAYLAPSWPNLARQCVHDGVLCVVLAVVALLMKAPVNARGLWRVAVWGGTLFALGPVLGAGAGGRVGSLAEVLVFALVPVITVFLVAQRDEGGGGLGRMMPALVAVGGLALVVPFARPQTGVGSAWVIGMVLCAGVFAVAGIRLHERMAVVSLVWAAAAGCGVAALISGVGWRLFKAGPLDLTLAKVGVEVGWGLLVDGPLALLTLWLLREMEPVGSSARFVLVPWVTIVGSVVVERPEVGWVSWLGLGLVVGAGWVLVRGGERRQYPGDDRN